jgi:hypothetical protein
MEQYSMSTLNELLADPCSAIQNRETGQEMALKMLMNVFSKPILAKRALREIKLLRHLHCHENVRPYLPLFRSRSILLSGGLYFRYSSSFRRLITRLQRFVKWTFQMLQISTLSFWWKT